MAKAGPLRDSIRERKRPRSLMWRLFRSHVALLRSMASGFGRIIARRIRLFHLPFLIENCPGYKTR